MTLFAYDPPADEEHPRRSFDGYDPSSSGSLRRDSAWLSFRTNARMQRSADRGKNHDEEREEFERDMLMLSLTSYKPSSEISFSSIGRFLGIPLFGSAQAELTHDKD